MPCSLLRPASRRSSLREMMDSLMTHGGGTVVDVRVKRPVPVPPDPTDAGLSGKDNTTMRAEVTPHALARQALPDDLAGVLFAGHLNQSEASGPARQAVEGNVN